MMRYHNCAEGRVQIVGMQPLDLVEHHLEELDHVINE
jgi:hypothetical protein